MSAAVLLDRLERVKQTGPGRWTAACPAHEDRSPSLSIRELADGRVLLHDFGQCPTEDVLAAVGLSMADLFERPIGGPEGARRAHTGIPPRDILEAIDFETTVVATLAAELSAGRDLTAEERERLRTAARRINAARDCLHGR